MHDGWEPPAEFVESLATGYGVPAARIAATTPEFRYFWKTRGERKKQAGWERAYSSNIQRLASGGALYVGVAAASPATTPLEDAARRARAERVEAQAKAAGRPA